MIQSMLLRTGPSELGHPDEVLAVHARILRLSPAQGRDIKVGSGRRVHVIEAGEGPLVVLLHGSSTSSLVPLPLLERLKGLRGIAVDRPGFGLSDPTGVPRERFRDAAVCTPAA
jgi:pimeloyl-ACP methyl ester carboxylesterase